MKVLLTTIFVAAVSALPTPDENYGPVELMVNGVPEGEPLKIAEILDVKLNQHTNGAVIAPNLLHPYTAVGIAEALANAEQSNKPDSVPVPAPIRVAPEVDIPGSVVLPEPVAPEVSVPDPVVPETIVPEIVVPEIVVPETVVPETVVPDTIDSETVVPYSVDVASPNTSEVEPAEEVPSPAAQDSEIYNDGVVSVSVNGPEDPGMLATLQSWFNMVINYFSDEGAQTSQQIF